MPTHVCVEEAEGTVIHGPAPHETIIGIEIPLRESDSYPPPDHHGDIRHGALHQCHRRGLGIAMILVVRLVRRVVILAIASVPHHVDQLSRLDGIRYPRHDPPLPFRFRSLVVRRRVVVQLVIVVHLVVVFPGRRALPTAHRRDLRIGRCDPRARSSGTPSW